MTSFRLWGILAIALALRAALMWPAFEGPHNTLTPDSGEYINLAGTVMLAGEYVGPIVPIRQAARSQAWASWFESGMGRWPEIFRTPGYPTFLAVAGAARGRVMLTEDQQVAGHMLLLDARSLRVAIAIQVLVDLHLVLLTFFLGRRLVGHGPGLLAALFQAVSPLAIASSCRMLSDGLFAFLLTAALLLLLRHFRTGGWRPLILAGVAMGVASYVRPVGLAMAAVMAAVLLLRAGRVRRTAAFAGLVLVIVAPWVVRNGLLADYWGFSSFATDSAYWYSAAEVVAKEKNESPDEVRQEFRGQEGWAPPQQLPASVAYTVEDSDLLMRTASDDASPDAPCYRTPGGLARYRWQRAREIIGAHPWMYMGIHLKGCMAFWLPGATDVLEIAGYTSGGKGTLDVLHRHGLWAAVRHYFGDNTQAMWLAGAMLLVPLVRYAGVLMLAARKLRPPWRWGAEVWLCLLLVLVAFLLPGPAAHPRFRVPVEPILSVAAAAGWMMLAARWRRRKGRGEEEGKENGEC